MSTIVFLLAAATALLGSSEANIVRASLFTPLKNDDHPCVAENLKETHRYICNDNAEVICLDGYKEPEDPDQKDLKNPCPVPICEYLHAGVNKTCEHGECVRPDVCACEVGWEGHLCDDCVRLPGCEHGGCENAFECNCNEEADPNDAGKFRARWEGAFCDKPACPPESCDPKHGRCYEPHTCTCEDGWAGEKCMDCKKLQGCSEHGTCAKDANGEFKPHTCECETEEYNEGDVTKTRPLYEGPLCDKPVCTKGCMGTCKEPNTCLCETGWRGEKCDECVPYWGCPKQDSSACVEPNQCICDNDNDNKVCNKEYINGPIFSVKPECSNPCQYNKAVESHEDLKLKLAGKFVHKCRWSDCEDKEAKDKEGNLITSKDKEGNPIPCHGNMKWKEADTLDLAKCEAPGAYLHVIEGKPEGM